MAATAQKIYEKALKLPEPLAKEILDFIVCKAHVLMN